MVDGMNRAGTKGAFHEILDAIRTLKSLEQTGRNAGPADKALMARFSGFGALATTAFPDPVTGGYAAGWEDLGRELERLLTDQEYASAKATTFSAFYTSPVVMGEMFRALERMGIGVGSRGLEPGCGVGNFIGASPIGLEFIGIEQDSLSGRMAKLVHPEHDIRVEGFQDTELPEGSVDFAIGNVPFAEIKLRYRGQLHSLHDYFFLKSLDAVRPGGMLALVTSRYTLDKANPAVRELLGSEADFAGAIRLPMEAFRDQGTSVVTDIIFLRKKPRELANELVANASVETESPEWANSRWLTASKVTLEGGEVTLNDYFSANPHMVLGQMSVGQGMYNNQTLRVRSDGELAAALHAAVDGLPENICTQRSAPLAAMPSLEIDPDLPPYVKEGSFYVAPDRSIMQVVGGRGEPVMMRDKHLSANGTPGGKRLGALIQLRDHTRHVLKTQQEGKSQPERDSARGLLRQAYANFSRQFGPINKTTLSERQDGTVVRRMPNVLRFRTDPDVYLVMALENYDERTGTAKPAAIMRRDVVTAAEPIDSVDSAKDGLLASLNNVGCVDIPYIASLYRRPESEVVEELGQLIFFDPIEGSYVPADEYLSGNVRDKLRFAESSEDPRTRGNARALAAVQPEDLVAEEIDVALGTPWIPAKDVQRFLVETIGIAPSSVAVEYVGKEALWKVRPASGYRTSAAAISEYGTEDVDAFTLVEQALNMRSPTVRRRVPGGPGESDTYVVDQEATLAAREKQSELKHKFSGWAFEDPDRSQRLVNFYNEHFNNLRLREFSGGHLTFPRMSSAIQMRPHQMDAVWRNMSSGNTLYAHVVGAGKTFTMVASGMEMKRTGLAMKPLYVVPNHMLEQFSREFLVLYPDANILVATKQDLTKTRRLLLKARMATGEWDGIVMTHSSFEKIAMSPDFQARFLADQVTEYEELLAGVEDRSLSRNITKKVEKLKAARKERLKEMAASGGKDGGLFFDELGIDQVFIDEAHMYKNLETPTKMDRVAGIQTGGSNRAFDLLMKARYLQSRTPGRGLTFATGTPVSNSLGEMYTMMRYLMPDLLKERGIEHFDAWAAAFGEVINSLEISPDGQSLRVNSRFAKFKNLPELLSLFRLSADVQTGAMLDLPTPKLVGGKAGIVATPMSDWQERVQTELVARYERVRGGGVDPREDNALKIITDGRKLALDGRLVDPHAEDDPESKINLLVDKVYEIWERTKGEGSTQMIFSDLGVSQTDWGFCVYDEIMDKLEARGIPREEIANIGDANTDQKKEALFSTVRSGRVRVLLGSTTKMGTGTNVQAKLYALHHVDPPWRPADIEQREGRILRQGNTNKQVEIYRYVTKGSFDAFMWQTLETKAKFITQAMMGDAGTRRADDIGGAELSFAEVKAIATGNPAMLVLAEMDLDVRQVTLLRKAHHRDQAKIAAQVGLLPQYIEGHSERISLLEQDVASRTDTKGDAFVMQVGDRVIQTKKGEKRTARMRAQDALALAVAKTHSDFLGTKMPWSQKLGTLGGLDVVLKADVDRLSKAGKLTVAIEGAGSYSVARIENPKNCPVLIQGLEQTLRSFDGKLAQYRATSEKWAVDLERYRERAGVPFASEAAYQELVPLRRSLKALLSKQETENKEDPEQAGPPVHEQIREVIDTYRSLSIHADEPTQAEETEVEDSVTAAVVEVPQAEAVEDPTLAQESTDMTAVETGSQHPDDGDRAVADVEVRVPEVPQAGDQAEIVEAAPRPEPANGVATTSTRKADDGDRASADAEVRVPEAPQASDQAEDAIAIVQQEDADGIGWFSLAVKVPGHDSWNIQSIYPQNTHHERHASEPRRKGYGWRDDAWVLSSLASEDDIPDLGQYLTGDERGQLIPGQREIIAQLVDAETVDDQLVHAELQVEGVEEELRSSAAQAARLNGASPRVPRSSDVTDAARKPHEPSASPHRDGKQAIAGGNQNRASSGAGRGQLGLFSAKPAASPRAKPSRRVSRPISSRPVQISLFDTPPADKPAGPVGQTIVAQAHRPAAWEVRVVSEPEEPQATTSDQVGAQATRRLSEIKEDDWTAEDETLFQAEMEARGQLRHDDAGEVERWRESLSAGDASDMQDMLENGAYVDEPEPTERAVLGKFTALVGDKPGLADIIHDAIEHYEPFGSMVDRIEREAGMQGNRSSADDRGTRSLYNATLAHRSSREATRW